MYTTLSPVTATSPLPEPLLIGASAAIASVRAAAIRVAASDAAVLIEGETGTGKELVARLVHARSRRQLRSFVSHNAGATPDTLIESELFGHARGAFTGAMRDHNGLFAAADGGTLFLDEIADVSPLMQAKLLRVLQEGEFRRVGEARARRVDVRIVAATNRSLETEIAAGRFRPDLYYRLHVVTIELPPLRARPEDIPLLVHHFTQRCARTDERPPIELAPAALDALRHYAWPGNVRELENEILRLTALHAGERVGAAELSERVRSAFLVRPTGPRAAGRELKAQVEALERSLIAERLVRFAGNKSRAARDLGLSRQGLAKKMRRYALGWLGAGEDAVDGGAAEVAPARPPAVLLPAGPETGPAAETETARRPPG